MFGRALNTVLLAWGKTNATAETIEVIQRQENQAY